MKKYIVKDRGLEWNYENKDNAEKKVTEEELDHLMDEPSPMEFRT